MDRNDMRTMARRILDEARSLKAAFPNQEAMRELPVSKRLPETTGAEGSALRAALVYLLDEMLLVRSGEATALTVLDDEFACVVRLLYDV